MNNVVHVTPGLQKLFNEGKLLTDGARLEFRSGLVDIQNYARKHHRHKSPIIERATEQQLLSEEPLRGRIYLNEAIAPEGVFLHEGTGLYGPKRKAYKIFPVNKKFLRFSSKNRIVAENSPISRTAGERWVFAKSATIKGIKPDPFIEKAVEIRAPVMFGKMTKAILKDLGQ